MPLVTIAMPAYNAARTISHALESVLAQTVTDIEVIVCDDASTDSTLDILSGYQDSRLTFISNEHNLGGGRARDRAIGRSQGKWVAVIDADDAWHPQRLEKLLACASSSENQIIFDNILICHDVCGDLVRWQPMRGSLAFGSYINEPLDIPFTRFLTSRRLLCKPLIANKLIRENNILHSSRKFAEDLEFLVKLVSYGGQLRYVPEPLYLYRVTPGSATGVAVDHTLMRQCLEECLGFGKWSAEIEGAFNKKIGMLREDETLYAIRDALLKGHPAAAVAALLRYPLALRALPYRLATHLNYERHRLRSGGSTR